MPTEQDGEVINENVLRELIDYQITNGIDGLCVFGSTGGFGSFDIEEMKTGIEVAATHAKGRAAVIAGTAANTTTACIALTKHAQQVGCAGALVIPASYWALTQREVYEHYVRLDSEVDIPICVYNNPWSTRFDMKPEFLAELAELKNISCIKESSADPTRITAREVSGLRYHAGSFR